MTHGQEHPCQLLQEGTALCFECYETISKRIADDSSESECDTCCTIGAPCTPVATWGPSRTAQDVFEEECNYADHLRFLETSNQVDGDYMSHQRLGAGQALLTPYRRASAVDWMVEAAWRLGLSNDALFLAVALLDRYLAQQAQPGMGSGAQLTLLAAVCLWVAAKYEHCTVPTLDTFSRGLLRGSFSNDAIIAMEVELLKTVDYRIASVTTAKTFLRRVMHDLGAVEASRGSCVDEMLYFLTSYLAEVSLLEYSLLSFLPSRVAATAFALAHTLLGRPVGADALKALTGYRPEDLAEPMWWLHHVHTVLAQAGSLYAITVKYQSPDMGCAAAVRPILSSADVRLAAAGAAA